MYRNTGNPYDIWSILYVPIQTRRNYFLAEARNITETVKSTATTVVVFSFKIDTQSFTEVEQQMQRRNLNDNKDQYGYCSKK